MNVGLVGAVGDGRAGVLGKTSSSLLSLDSSIPLLLPEHRVVGFITLNEQVDLLSSLHQLLLAVSDHDHLLHVHCVRELDSVDVLSLFPFEIYPHNSLGDGIPISLREAKKCRNDQLSYFCH